MGVVLAADLSGETNEAEGREGSGGGDAGPKIHDCLCN